MTQAKKTITKEEILDQLKKEGVTDLNQFAEFLIKKVHRDGDPSQPIVASAIVYGHGFVSH
ncbi:hypothetical protein [Pseudomonas sp. RIT-PI-AD]|uniref:hypothetical protein n=1 Tax=Pseudomonas sp. RIT-PI-AD TaxID=3035294 RepID=UPI0021D83481|nr:hypothetical protein [Pseudomonas sp. RIT-PI-AD]